MKKIFTMSIREFLKILDETLEETTNKGIDEEDIKDLDKKEINKANNDYRLYGQIFGLNYIMNLLDNLGIKESEE